MPVAVEHTINLVLLLGGIVCIIWACVLWDSFKFGRAAVAALGGVVLVMFWFNVPHIHQPPIRSNVARALGDLHSLNVVVECFYTDEGRYPTLRELCDASLLNDGIPAEIPEATRTLTSPIAYMHHLPGDVWRGGDWHYGYWTDGSVFLVRSYGPDKARTANLEALGRYFSACGPKSETAFASTEWHEKYEVWIYDMSNGITSRGDLIRTGP